MHLRLAVTPFARLRGQLGRPEPVPMLIAPCSAVHTFFMRFAIDVIFTDRDGRVSRCVPAVRPWRITGTLRGFATIELAAGTIDRTGTRRGHTLELRDA